MLIELEAHWHINKLVKFSDFTYYKWFLRMTKLKASGILPPLDWPKVNLNGAIQIEGSFMAAIMRDSKGETHEV